MNRRRVIVFAVLLILISTVLWERFRPLPTKPDQSPVTSLLESNTSTKPGQPLHLKSAQGANLSGAPKQTVQSTGSDSELLKKLSDAFSAPIAFYGQVVDEAGQPIAGASIRFEAVDKPFGEASVYLRTSDAAGMFSLEGARGSSVSLWVSKAGYHSTGASKGRFVYGGVRGGDEPQNPVPGKPAIFVLRKMGETVPLHAVDRDVIIPKDGSPVEISLHTGRAVPPGQGDLVVECQTRNEGLDPNKNAPYDWHLRLTVPNGGLFERVGEFTFEAPETGYRSNEEVNMPSGEKGWRRNFRREYFIKTGAGTFARIDFRMTTGGGHFVTIQGYLNPIPGSRNLEFDPKKAIAAPR